MAKRAFGFVVAVLLVVILAFLAGRITSEPPQKADGTPGISPVPEAPTQASAGQELEADVESSQESTTEESSKDTPHSSSGPRVELYPAYTTRDSLGNGLDMYRVWITLKNATYSWYSYTFADQLGGREAYPVGSVSETCSWVATNGQRIPPVLFTKEGGQYEATTYPEGCGPRWVPTIPPGLVVTGMGETLTTAWALGWATFEIPEGATPEKVQFPHGTAQWLGIEERLEGVQLTAMVLDSPYSGSMPFDETFGERIFQVGETIPIGDLAEVSFESVGTSSDGTLSVTMTIASKNGLYPVEPVYGFSHTSLVNQSGVICCGVRVVSDSVSSTWGVDEPVGPNQTKSYSVVFENLNRDRVWLFGQMRLQEVSSQETAADVSFVVELP